jgi:quercetin dioxygenase-like cupin family protein
MRHYKASDRPWEQGKGYQKKRLLAGDILPKKVDLVQEVRFSKGSSVPLHYHRVQTEIFYVLGRGSININGRDIAAEPGDIIVCEPGDVHGNPRIDEDFGFLVMKVDYREDDTVWL